MDKPTEKLAISFYLAAILAARRTNMTPWQAATDAAQLVMIGRRLINLGIASSNKGDTPQRDKAHEHLTSEASVIANKYGLSAESSGDPRGYVLRLHGEGLPRNNMGDGFGVA